MLPGYPRSILKIQGTCCYECDLSGAGLDKHSSRSHMSRRFVWKDSALLESLNGAGPLLDVGDTNHALALYHGRQTNEHLYLFVQPVYNDD